MAFWPVEICCARCSSSDVVMLARPAVSGAVRLRSVWQCVSCDHEMIVTIGIDGTGDAHHLVDRVVAYHAGNDLSTRRKDREPPKCGSERGYHHHRRALKEPACAHCRAAHSAYEASRASGHPNSGDLVVPFPDPLFEAV